MKTKNFFVGLSAISAVFAIFLAVIFLAQNTTHDIAEGSSSIVNETENYKSFTDSDKLLFNSAKSIQDYSANLYQSNSYVTKNTETGSFTLTATGDDPIVEIIPKELFRTVGQHLAIGREYGFFVNTQKEVREYKEDGQWVTVQSPTNYHSTVLVFDIITQHNFVETVDKLIVSVKNLFQFDYVYIGANTSFFSAEKTTDSYDGTVNCSLSAERVVPLPKLKLGTVSYASSMRYFIKDVAIGAQLANEQEKNTTNTGYNANLDNGAFFTGFDFAYNGRTLQNGSFINTAILHANNASFVLGALSLTGIPFVSQLFSWGSTILGLPGFLINVADTITNDPATATYQQSKITATSLYQTKPHQIAQYGKLMKTAAIASTTKNSGNIVYGTNNSVTAAFSVSNSAQVGEDEYLTRIVTEIALQIVDKNLNTVAHASNSEYFIQGEPVYKSASMASTGQVNLLPNGKNYFKFLTQHSGKYKIYINTVGTVGCKVNGETLTGTQNQYIVEFGSETLNYIELTGGSARIIGELSIELASSLSNFTIEANETYLIKFDNPTIAYRTFTSTNPNIVITGIKEIKNGALWDYIVDPQNIEATVRLDMPLTTGTKFLVLKNKASSSQSGSITIGDVPTIDIGEQQITVDANRRYYKFSVVTGGSYLFTFNFGNIFLNANIRYGNLQEAVITDFAHTLMIYGVPQNTTLWLGVISSNGLTNGKVDIREFDNAYQWKIDGKFISGQNAILETTGSYHLELWYNGKVKTTNFELDLNHKKYGQVTNEGLLTISETFPCNSGYIIILDKTYNFKLHIAIKKDNKIFITTGENSQTTLSFNWTLNPKVGDIKQFEYKLVYSNQEIIKTVFTTQTSGTVNILDSIGNISVDVLKVYIYRIGLGEELLLYACPDPLLHINALYGGGEGTSSSPYLITYPRHFNNIKHYLRRSYKQTATLDFQQKETCQDNITFDGDYNGNGKSIININIKGDKGIHIGGMFASNSGKIYGIFLFTVTINFKKTGMVGGLVSMNTGEIDAPAMMTYNLRADYTNYCVGGVVGWNKGIVRGGICGGTIHSNYGAGGIISANLKGGTLIGGKCSAKIYRKSNASGVGGIYGTNTGTILNNPTFTGTIGYY